MPAGIELNVTVAKDHTAPTRPPTHLPTQPPTPTPCMGNSSKLDPAECGIWQKLFDEHNGRQWSHCSHLRDDPCGCFWMDASLDAAEPPLRGVNAGYFCDPSKWDDGHGHIQGLDLSRNGLHGTLPSSLAKLSFLSNIILYGNKLTGKLPALPFDQYTKRGKLDIAPWCHLDCKSDPKGQCTDESGVPAGDNDFACPLPSGAANKCKYGNPPKQQGASCSGTAPPTPPPTPPPATSCPNLDAHECRIWQEFYDTHGADKWNHCKDKRDDPCSCSYKGPFFDAGITCVNGHIVRFWMVANSMTGSIPSSLGGLGQLTKIDLLGNNLTSTIPPELSKLTKLQELAVGYNMLTGQIPSSLGGLTAMTQLWLDDNILNGTIPSELSKCTSLTKIDTHNNKLTGIVPPLPFAHYADGCWLDDPVGCKPPICNHFSCPLPPNADQCTGGEANGAGVHCIPSCTGKSSGLPQVECSAWQTFHDALLDKSIDGTMCKDHRNDPCGCTATCDADHADVCINCVGGHITQITFSEQGLVGSFPTAIGHLMEIDYFRVDGDLTVTGSIPTEFGRLTKLTDIDIGSNLTGPIPTEFGALKALTKLYIGNNKLTGPIPTELVQLVALKEISLDHNKLTGIVPKLPFAQYTGKCAIYDEQRQVRCFHWPTWLLSL
jgi:Leucine-rich repeat (LRR) protein